MKDESMTKRQPLEELGELQRRIANLEKLRKKHKKDKDALKKSEGLYRSLFESMLNGFAYCQMHFDEQDKPRDFTYLVVNKSFETLTGLKDIVGKKVSEVIPGIREEDPELLEIYGRVAKSG